MSERFWTKVKRGTPEECWLWLGFKKKSGHGLTSYKSSPIHASRKAWILTHGEIRDGLSALHRCDVAACCNPAHLYLGTRADNMVDLFGKTPPGERVMGRTRVLNDEQLEKLWMMRKNKVPLKECARKFDVHIATICRYITEVRRQKLAKVWGDRLPLSRGTMYSAK